MQLDIHSHRILILDFGSQYTQLIARRVRELGVFCELRAYDATEEEINHEISHIASHNKMSPAALKDRLTKEGGLASIRAAIRHKKTLQFLVDNANLTTETVTPANDQSASAES